MPRQMIERIDLKTQTKRALRTYIHTLPSEQNKLPREEELCDLIGVSRVTLRSALDELASEGVVLRRQGKGTFVNRAGLGIQAVFNPAQHFSEVIANSGYIPRIEPLGWTLEPVSDEFARAFSIPKDVDGIRMRKLFYADDRPCVYCEDLLPADIWQDAPIPNNSESLFQSLYVRTGRKAAWDKVEIAVCSSQSKAELECFGEKPLLLLKSLIFNNEDQPMFYAWEYIDTDLLSLSQIRRREFTYDRE